MVRDEDAVDAPEDRASLRTRRRFARRQWARRWLSWRYFVALLLLVAGLVTAVWLVLYSTTLQVQQVEVTGNELLSDDEVREVAGVPLGEQLALVDLQSAAARLTNVLPQVRTVDVVRNWPDTVEIHVEERVAVAVVDYGSALWALDAEGVEFTKLKRVPPRMPRVRVRSTVSGDALAEAAAVVSALPDGIASRVAHVEVESIDRITLVLRGGRQVLWGSAEESDQKARVLEVLLGEKGQVFDVSVPGSPTSR